MGARYCTRLRAALRRLGLATGTDRLVEGSDNEGFLVAPTRRALAAGQAVVRRMTDADETDAVLDRLRTLGVREIFQDWKHLAWEGDAIALQSLRVRLRLVATAVTAKGVRLTFEVRRVARTSTARPGPGGATAPEAAMITSADDEPGSPVGDGEPPAAPVTNEPDDSQVIPALAAENGALARFAPRIQELRRLAARHPGLARLSLSELCAFVAAAPRRPLTALTPDEVEDLVAAVLAAPRPAVRPRIVNVTALYEDAPPILLEVDLPPCLHVAVGETGDVEPTHHEWPLSRLLGEVRGRMRSAADRGWVVFLFGSTRDFLVIRAEGPDRLTAEHVVDEGREPDSRLTFREVLTEAQLTRVLHDYYALWTSRRNCVGHDWLGEEGDAAADPR